MRALAAALLVAVCLVSNAAAAEPGDVNFFRTADSSFDVFTKAPTLEQQAWMREHYFRMRVYGPYFDTRTAWYPFGLLYQDSYAIYVGSALAAAHPDWILKDSAGNPMYIPWGAKPYTQYAGDITNPAFVENWIATAKQRLSQGTYKGLFVDDVNFYRRVATATGDQTVTPYGLAGPLSEQAWQSWMGNYMAWIKARIPAELVHNSIWYVPNNARVTYGNQQATGVDIEHGVIDGGITGGTGKYALRTMLAYADRLHSLGKTVIFDGNATTDTQREYQLACYLLVSNGSDMVGTHAGGTPTDWWRGWDINLGNALGPRQVLSNGLIHRAFERGEVYVNEPGATSKTVNGSTLGPGQGWVTGL